MLVAEAEATAEDRAKRLPNGLAGATKSGSKLVASVDGRDSARSSCSREGGEPDGDRSRG